MSRFLLCLLYILVAPIFQGSLAAPGLGAQGVDAYEYEALRKDGLLVLYPARYQREAETSLDILRKARRDIAGQLGLPESTPATIELIPSAERFENRAGPKSHLKVLGIAYSPQGRILINLSRLTVSWHNNLYETLAHEMTHVMLGSFEVQYGVQLPRWFHEGVASWQGRVLPAIPEDQRLETAANLDSLPPLYLLERSFPDYQAGTEIAYLASEHFIRFLLDRHGPDAIARILEALKTKGVLRTAVPEALGVDLLEEEALWLAELRHDYPLLWIIQHNFTILTAGALLTILSFLLYRFRRRQILKRMDEREIHENHERHERADPQTHG